MNIILTIAIAFAVTGILKYARVRGFHFELFAAEVYRKIFLKKKKDEQNGI